MKLVKRLLKGTGIVIVDINQKDLGVLRDLTDSGSIAPALTKTYPLTETAAAYNYLETGHVQGKIAITIE